MPDFLGANVSYGIENTIFHGTPRTAANAANIANLLISLPEGKGYVVTPTAKVLNPGGPPSTTTFPITTITSLGCGELKNIVPGLDISFDPSLPRCAQDSGLVDFNIKVNTNGNDTVSRIYYKVNDGAEIDICPSDCGDDPEFMVTATIEKGNNIIKVFATSPAGTVSSEDQIEFGTPQCIIETLACDKEAPGAIFGTAGNDTLLGTSGADVIFGMGGNDTIFGFGGDDCIDGGEGNDKILGGPGDDHIVGGSGDDQIFNDAGNDVTNSGPGNDRVLGGAGNDIIGGDTGDDHINGNPGNDQVLGGPGDDVLIGSGGNDELDGESGNDDIRGGPGTDSCVGVGGGSVSQCE
jgi:Ca2+-binding RTX toxin-like protein